MQMKKIYLFITIAIVGLFSQSCVGDDVETDFTLILKDVALSSFRLGSNDKVMKDLDSVFFTIDLIKGKVYNADSLPLGSSLKKITLDMTFVYPSLVVVYYGKDGKDSMDYMKHPTDTIDMSEGARMKVVSADGSAMKFYDLKINVHKLIPDSLQWDDMTQYKFPEENTLQDQKTVLKGGKIYSFLKVQDVYRLWAAEAGGWQQVGTPQFGFNPDIYYMQVFNDKLYVPDAETKQIYVSTDGLSWTADPNLTDIDNLIGILEGINGQKSLLVGIATVDSKYHHFVYDGTVKSVGEEIDPGFPVSGYSNAVSFKGGVLQQMAIAGGKLQNGRLTNAVWGFDGSGWAIFNNINSVEDMFEPREGALLFNYFADEALDMPLWILIGGRGEGSLYMKDVFSSPNNGVDWVDGPTSLLLPEDFPFISYGSAFVLKNMPFDGAAYNGTAVNLPVLRTAYKMRRIVNYASTKEVPYIYIFGGEGLNSAGEPIVQNQIWRAVINRLKFDPIQ